MANPISDKSISDQLSRNLSKAQESEQDAITKLSSGTVFTPQDPRPGDKTIAESMEYRIRSLNAAKRNINDAGSLLDTAEGGMNEIANILIRMKEINIAAASSTMSDQERRYLFIEHAALYNEINRIALTTEFNGIPLLNGKSDRAPETLILRLGDPFVEESLVSHGEDVNTIRLTNMKHIDMTTAGLSLKSSKDLIEDSSDIEGISLDSAMDLMTADDDAFATSYDQALSVLSSNRAVYGALQSRLKRAIDYVDVYQENIEAAKSKIADTDYAREVTNLAKAKILMQANTSLMAQSHVDTQQTLQLLNSVL